MPILLEIPSLLVIPTLAVPTAHVHPRYRRRLLGTTAADSGVSWLVNAAVAAGAVAVATDDATGAGGTDESKDDAAGNDAAGDDATNDVDGAARTWTERT